MYSTIGWLTFFLWIFKVSKKRSDNSASPGSLHKLQISMSFHQNDRQCDFGQRCTFPKEKWKLFRIHHNKSSECHYRWFLDYIPWCDNEEATLFKSWVNSSAGAQVAPENARNLTHMGQLLGWVLRLLPPWPPLLTCFWKSRYKMYKGSEIKVVLVLALTVLEYVLWCLKHSIITENSI